MRTEKTSNGYHDGKNIFTRNRAFLLADLPDVENWEYMNINANKELFLAEYNSLRGEIQQRISHQTTLHQTAITAFGLITSYALEKIDLRSFNDVYLILVYPLLAYFISFAWAFNHTRICQIAEYLKDRENQIPKYLRFFGWENHVHKIDMKNKDLNHPGISSKFIKTIVESVIGTNKVKPGITILSGTQVISIVIGAALMVFHANSAGEEIKVSAGAVAFILFDVVVFYLTLLTLDKSGRQEIITL